MHHVSEPSAPEPQASAPSDTTPLHVHIARRSAKAPGATAVVDGERTLSYGELERRANQLAHLLISLGAAPAAPVGVCLRRGVDLVVSLLAVWKAGAAYVPLDPSHPAARTSGVLAETGAALVIAEADEAALVTGRAGADFRTVSPVLDEETRGRLPHDAPEVPVSSEHPAYVLYTSGSTGKPKGVVVAHGGLANQVGWRVRTHKLGPCDRVLQKTPLTFDAAGWEVFAPLVGGGTVVMAPAGAERDPALLVRSVAEHGVTVLQVVPSVLRMLVEESGWERCTDLRLLSSGGEQLHAELVQRFLRCVDGVPGDVEVWNTYGPTECTNEVTGRRFDAFQRSGPVPIGTAVDGMRLLVLHPDGTRVEPGIKGELYLGGPGVAHGYIGRPALTADRFVPDPYGPPGARLYRTGDVVRERVDGSLEHLGRTDRQVKVDGVRIEPAEVEDALAAHPGVLEGAVAPYRAPDGSTRLAAYVRCRDGAAPATDELRGFLSARLPDSHLPAVCVPLDDFPRTASGKLDRLSLPVPDVGAGPDDLPATDAERLVAKVWQELFRTESVGVHDDFFRLGGSSLQLTRLANRLREATGREIELPRLLRATTVAAQARLITPDGDGPAGHGPADGEAAVRPVPRTGSLPLSPGQRRLWLLDRIDPGSREWVTGVFLRVPRGDSREMVQQALDELVRRHESLRTRFVAPEGADGDPAQIVGTPAPMELRTLTAPRSEAAALVEEDAQRGFDLETGPVVRALLICPPDHTDAGERTLVLLMHHIVGDGWSATILKREFHEILGALREGRRSQLPEPEVHYADYAVWQQRRLTDDFVARELAHWKKVLDGAAPLALRTDKRRPPARDARGSIVTFTVPRPLADAVTELGRRGDATDYMTLLTAFTTLLARYTAQWDVTIGTPVAGRERPEIEGVVGFFLNTLALRCPLDGSLAFEEALDHVRDVCLEAFGHQELPFEELVAELAPERDLSRTPLYQVAFDYHDEALSGSAADAAEMDAVAGISTVAKTDLTLYMRKQPDGTVLGALEYATSLFERATVEGMAGHFLRLLRSAVAEPAGRLDTLDLLPDAERRELSRVNHCPAEPVTASVPALFERQAAATPDAVALVTDGGETTFAELDRRANRLARRLRSLGVGPESPVGVLLDRGAALPTAFLAVWKAGGAYVPLDPSFPAERVGQVLADAGARVLITGSVHAEALSGVFAGTVVTTDADTEPTDAALTDAGSGGPLEDPAHLDRRQGGDLDLLAYVIYTSGSTGRPKGVQITHRGLANHVRWAVDELASRGTGGGAVFSSVAFDLVVPNLWAPLLAGQPMRLLPQDLDLGELGTRLREGGPFSFLKLTPGHLDIIGRQLTPAQMKELAGAVVVAGEALPVRLADEWARALGPGGLINEYGPTEASVGTCTHPVTGPTAGGSVPIGRPLPGVTMHVLDDLMRPVPAGVVGELYVGGTGLARGYGSRPQMTAARFVPDPYGGEGARLYRTGDLVRLLPDGSTDFVGRIDGQVKIRGYRVETGEIKSVLDEHPGVRESVVVTVQDADGSSSLAAYWVPASEDDDPAEVRKALVAHCAGRLPDYMVPVTVTPIGSVPLNANGKLDRAALPAAEREESEEQLVEPEGVVEERIAELFGELLGVRAGAHSHFFRSGGNSILAIRLIAEIQAAFDIDFPARAVFEGGTVAELAAVVEAEVRAEIEAMSESELRTEAMKGDEDGPQPSE